MQGGPRATPRGPAIHMCSNVSYRLKEHVTRRDSAIFHVFIDVIVICLKALLNSEELLFSISHTKKKKRQLLTNGGRDGIENILTLKRVPQA